MSLGNSLHMVFKRAVVKPQSAQRLSNEWVVMFVWPGLNQGDAERRVVFSETRCQDTACKSTAQDEIIGHGIERDSGSEICWDLDFCWK